MNKECPSCGNIIKDGQLYCPACGTKIINKNVAVNKVVNSGLEACLFKVDSEAEIALVKNCGTSIWEEKNTKKLIQLENDYLEIIQKYPSESKAYIAYVDYMIKYVVKINSTPAYKGVYIENIDLIVNRCKNYLSKAKEFASEDELENILQLESLLSSKIEAIENDDTIKEKNKKSKIVWKVAMGIIIFIVVWNLILAIIG